METRRLGRLEHQSSVLIYGAAALGGVTQAEADASVEEALAAGINHVDTAPSYGDAELRLGPWMPEIRNRIFLATKTGERDAEAAYREIVSSLERLQTDHLDLLQLHAVGTEEELDEVTAPAGALAGAVRAQDEGLVGAIGITGHGHRAPATHTEALRRFPFATVLTPLNWVLTQDPGYLAAYERLVSEVRRQDAALMVIKTVARRVWPGPPDHATWYQPFSDPEHIRAAVSWALCHAELVGLATPGDVRLLRHVIAAEADRMKLVEATDVLTRTPDYSSPFLAPIS
ncbi:MAG: aldo/keto reductase [Frankiaceae bacterium]|nr:aldo/keto reductase [Frankiaceae bacterium]